MFTFDVGTKKTTMSASFSEMSRVLSHALRHEPWLYELELDDEAWVPVEDVVSALRRQRPEWSAITESDIVRMIAESDKHRHEIAGGRIRALYGHSVPGKLKKARAVPPNLLYHGTAPDTVLSIRSHGLLPMGRQYVHLSVDEATALQVGQRKASQPSILRVLANQAHAAGFRFYEGNDRVWLADRVPADFIIFVD